MSRPTVLAETKEWVRTLTLNRPEARNAFNSRQYRELFEALGEAENDDSVRVVVLTVATGACTAGQDLGEMTAPP